MANNKEEDLEDIQKAFEEEINKPYYRVDYLDDFKLPYEKLDVSVVVPTYNRCPYKPRTLREDLNPLYWSVKSIILQKPKINELIIVNDKSEDYTEEVVESLKEEIKNAGIKLIYIKNRSNKGNAISRDIGLEKANSKFIFFADDDCALSPYSVFGAIYTFEKLEERGIKVGSINLPTYFRRSMPKKVVSKKDIGKLDFVRGLYTTNKDAFPVEYLGKDEKKFLDVELHILEPFLITNFNTFGVCSKKAYQDVGGFRAISLKRGIDREFGCRLIENGYSIYFSPDPKFHCVHGSYGLNVGVGFEGEDWLAKISNLSLKRIMKECDKPSEKTGMRINQKDYLTEAIVSFFTLTYPRNKKGALRWIKKVYYEFVQKGDVSIFGGADLKIPAENERKEMWKTAINRGLAYIKRKEKEDIKKVERIFNKLKNEETNFENALRMISEV